MIQNTSKAHIQAQIYKAQQQQRSTASINTVGTQQKVQNTEAGTAQTPVGKRRQQKGRMVMVINNNCKLQKSACNHLHVRAKAGASGMGTMGSKPGKSCLESWPLEKGENKIKIKCKNASIFMQINQMANEIGETTHIMGLLL